MKFLKSLSEYDKGIVFIFSKLEKPCRRCGQTSFREIKSDLSLDFPTFGPSVLDGARSKVDLSFKGYACAPILWSFDKSKR